MPEPAEIDIADPSPEMVFDDAPISIPVTVGGKKYVLREALGVAAKKYRAASLSGSEMDINDDTGIRTVKRLQSVADVEALLVSLCLFDNCGRPVKKETIEGWPSKVQKRLFEKIKEISELDESDKLEDLLKQKVRLEKRISRLKKGDPAKNGQNSSTDGSDSDESSGKTPSS